MSRRGIKMENKNTNNQGNHNGQNKPHDNNGNHNGNGGTEHKPGKSHAMPLKYEQK
jgi:hypothetical protein